VVGGTSQRKGAQKEQDLLGWAGAIVRTSALFASEIGRTQGL
jgi:hypothetical protein